TPPSRTVGKGNHFNCIGVHWIIGLSFKSEPTCFSMSATPTSIAHKPFGCSAMMGDSCDLNVSLDRMHPLARRKVFSVAIDYLIHCDNLLQLPHIRDPSHDRRGRRHRRRHQVGAAAAALAAFEVAV